MLARQKTAPTLRGPDVATRWRAPLRLGLSVFGLAMLATFYASGGAGYDFMAYWTVDASAPYSTPIGLGAFHYPPPFVYLAAPLSLLPFDIAYVVWTILMVGLLIWMTRSWALAWCGFPPVASELFHGNIHIAMAALIVVGLRYPPALAVVGLAKLTTGVALLWPVFRRDLRSFVAASATVVGIVVVSLILQGSGVWAAWFDHLFVRAETTHIGGALIDIPLAVRLPVAVGLLAWVAKTDRPWTLVVAVALSMPLLWIHSLAVLVALPAVLRFSTSNADTT